MKMLLQDLKTLSVQNKFAGHFHDTYGQGLVNVLTCLEVNCCYLRLIICIFRPELLLLILQLED